MRLPTARNAPQRTPYPTHQSPALPQDGAFAYPNATSQTRESAAFSHASFSTPITRRLPHKHPSSLQPDASLAACAPSHQTATAATGTPAPFHPPAPPRHRKYTPKTPPQPTAQQPTHRHPRYTATYAQAPRPPRPYNNRPTATSQTGHPETTERDRIWILSRSYVGFRRGKRALNDYLLKRSL